MNLGGIRALVLGRLDNDTVTPETWTIAEANAAINEGQQLMVLMTLCLEKVNPSFALPTTSPFTDPLAQCTDWIVPVRVTDTAGNKLPPIRISELDVLDSNWRQAKGAPKNYGTRGWNLFFLYPFSMLSISVRYACSAATLALDSDIPQVPEQHHPALVNYAIYRLREKMGGLEFQKGLLNLGEFFESTKQLSAYTRTRALGSRYDVFPVELARLDLSRLLKIRKDLLPARKAEPDAD